MVIGDTNGTDSNCVIALVEGVNAEIYGPMHAATFLGVQNSCTASKYLGLVPSVYLTNKLIFFPFTPLPALIRSTAVFIPCNDSLAVSLSLPITTTISTLLALST